jgi:hypothetical protein
MTKLEFIKELESLLSDIPLEEREEALRYYSGYFEDAGEEHEEEVIKELGSPKRVASIIKEDLISNAPDRESRGYFTEKGYQDTRIDAEKCEVVGAVSKSTDNKQADHVNRDGARTNNSYQNGAYQSGANQSNANNGTSSNYYNNSGRYYSADAQKAVKESSRNSNIALIIILCFFGWPFIIAAFGIVISIFFTIVGIVIGFGIAGIVMIISGIALIAAGFVQISVPLMGLLLFGSGFLVFGLGMLFTSISVALCKTVLPAMMKGIVNLCRRPFQNRSVMA